MTIIQHNEILGVILAGGRNRRMGDTPKWQLPLDNKPILDHIIERITPQVGQLIINGNTDSFTHYNLPVIGDISNDQGPLAGIYASLIYAQQQSYSWIATVPCDSPFFPNNWVSKLHQTVDQTNLLGATISSHGRKQPIFALWSTSLIEPLEKWLKNEQNLSLKEWCKYLQSQISIIDMNDLPEKSFFNINTPEDWEAAQALLTKPN